MPALNNGHAGDIVPLSLYSTTELALHHRPPPQVYSKADSVQPPSSSARHPGGISALPDRPRHPAISSLPLPEALLSLSPALLSPSPPLKRRSSIFNGGHCVVLCATEWGAAARESVVEGQRRIGAVKTAEADSWAAGD